jgi:hypothetical protein
MATDPTKKEGLSKVTEIQEVPKTPEQAKEVEIDQSPVEQAVEGEVASPSESMAVNESPTEEPLVTTRQAPVPPKELDRLEEEIEDILEEDLKEMYLAMPAESQAKFRATGEETRSKIREIVRSAKVNAKKIFVLIRAWLKIIPGVNRFFLEQEAKIKTDKILFVTEEEKKRN